MFIKIKQEKSNTYYEMQIEKIITAIDYADKIVIGAGSGLSTAAGMDYQSEFFFKTYYPKFYATDCRTVIEAVHKYWHLNKKTATRYWGFWSHHVHVMHYSKRSKNTYKMLYDIINPKEYFIITSNVDDQLFRVFPKNKIYSMQGSYGKFQCQDNCHSRIYDNKDQINKMIHTINEKTMEIDSKLVPTCPKCGGLMTLNLRRDHSFSENPDHSIIDKYHHFTDVVNEKILFLELGVGFNTPHIIRYPFEDMTLNFQNAKLIRISLDHDYVPEEIRDKSIVLDMDIHTLLERIHEK